MMYNKEIYIVCASSALMRQNFPQPISQSTIEAIQNGLKSVTISLNKMASLVKSLATIFNNFEDYLSGRSWQGKNMTSFASVK